MKFCPECGAKLANGVHTCPAAVPTAPAGTRPVIVTTAHRGVFFGYAGDTTGETIKLLRSRLAVYWSVGTKGFMGLASDGPGTDCRIGKPADITLRNITAVLEVTPEAVTKWESAPWK
jgi:hypothetical protein